MAMIGAHIKRVRIQRRLTLSELAAKAGISKSYLSYIERGIQENPSFLVLTRLSKALGVPLEILMEEGHPEIDMTAEVDEEWLKLLEEAVRTGVSKEEFSLYLDFIKFRNKKSH